MKPRWMRMEMTVIEKLKKLSIESIILEIHEVADVVAKHQMMKLTLSLIS